MTVSSSLSSDALLALIFPLVILLIAFRNPEFRSVFSFSLKSQEDYPAFSVQQAHRAFTSYGQLSERELRAKRSSFATLTHANKSLARKIGYERKLDRAREIIHLNSTVTEGIAELAEEEMPLLSLQKNTGSRVNLEDLSLVREVLKHFVRDWSEDGREERARIFDPILDVLKTVHRAKRGSTRVLVPGCGLGRLAWEVSELGFETTANDLSPYMIFSLRFLLSPKHTSKLNQHTIRPYAYWFSHQRSNTSLFRAISFPDVLPRPSRTFHIIQGDFMTLSPPTVAHLPSEGSGSVGYDYIVTLFFIDTSIDVFATVSKIHALLRPGGTWINLGPLLWTGGARAKVELSLEEVMSTVREIGFHVLGEKEEVSREFRSRTVECEYTADKEAMMRWIYRAEFWVARKFAY